MLKKDQYVYLLFCLIFYSFLTVSSYAFTAEEESASKNNPAVQSALDYIEEIREQRNEEKLQEAAQDKDDLDTLVDKIIQEVESTRKKVIIDKFQVEKMPVSEAVRVIAEKAGLKSEVEASLLQEVTLYLNNIEMMDLLSIICDIHSLAYMLEGDTIYLMTLETYEMKNGYKYQPDMVTRMIPLRYVNYADILVALDEMKSDLGEILYDANANALVVKDQVSFLTKIETFMGRIDVFVETRIFDVPAEYFSDTVKEVQSRLTPDVGIVSEQAQDNRMIVTDVPDKLEEIRKLVEMKNSKFEMEYELKAVQVILYEENEDGVDWDAIVSDYQRIKCLKHEESLSSKEKEFLSLGTVSAEDFAILLEALDTVGEIEVLSEVNKITSDAQLSLSAEYKEAVIPPGSTIKEAKEESRALRINVSFLGEEGENFSLSLSPCLLDGRKEGNANCNPMVDAAGVSLHVANGSTIVIGSLLKDVIVESIRKIPLLGDLPFLGFAFRNQGTKMGKSEVIFFISIKKTEE